jgi:ABC-type sugar transport system ATPase subunit
VTADAGPRSEPRHPPLWEARGIVKLFPGVAALKGVDLVVHAGEIHALVGENGSGKSTLIKALAGVHRPDSGQIRRLGHEIHLPNPTAARAAGVATIFQEFSLVGSLSVAENVLLGRLPRRSASRLVDWRRMEREVRDQTRAVGLDVDPARRVSTLSVAEQQLVEIVKAISAESNLLIMDEPTTALSLPEVERLHAVVRALADSGKAVLYVSHRLQEVLGLVDTVTVLRDGERVGSWPAGSLDMGILVRHIVGRSLRQFYVKEDHATATPVLEARDLATTGGVHHATFTVHAGEVLGLAGVVGSGRTQIARALMGMDRISHGDLRLDGRPFHPRGPADAIEQGLGFVPENRKTDAIFFNLLAVPNMTSARIQSLRRAALLDLGRERRAGSDLIDRLRITPAVVNRNLRHVSGGNQQKTVIGRWLFAGSRVLILDEPTQGIDVGARVEVYRLINELTSNGIAILLVSSDFSELVAMSDRIAVIRGGRVLDVRPARDLDEFKLTRLVATSAAEEEVR